MALETSLAGLHCRSVPVATLRGRNGARGISQAAKHRITTHACTPASCDVEAPDEIARSISIPRRDTSRRRRNDPQILCGIFGTRSNDLARRLPISRSIFRASDGGILEAAELVARLLDQYSSQERRLTLGKPAIETCGAEESASSRH